MKPTLEPKKHKPPKPKLPRCYKISKVFSETLTGYQEASMTKPIDTYFKKEVK